MLRKGALKLSLFFFYLLQDRIRGAIHYTLADSNGAALMFLKRVLVNLSFTSFLDPKMFSVRVKENCSPGSHIINPDSSTPRFFLQTLESIKPSNPLMAGERAYLQQELGLEETIQELPNTASAAISFMGGNKIATTGTPGAEYCRLRGHR